MRFCRILAACLLIAGLAVRAVADDKQEKRAEAPPSLDGVTWADQSVTFDGLRGKTVVVLVYATWCPQCNSWSGEFLSQLKTAIQDKPVVVLAIYADEKPGI